MGVFEMVVAIVAVVTIGKIIQAKQQRDAAAATDRTGYDSVEVERLRAEVRTLSERVQVLERVVTDNHSSVSLTQEIERLRDRDARF